MSRLHFCKTGEHTGMTYEEAIEHLQAEPQCAVAREGWNGKGQYIRIHIPDEDSKDTFPYLYIVTVQKQCVPWLASQTDILAKDWFELGTDEYDPAL